MFIKPQFRVGYIAKDGKVTGLSEWQRRSHLDTQPLFDMIYSNPWLLQIKHE